MNSDDPPDERVIYRERFQGVYFDFRGKSISPAMIVASS